MLCGSRARAEFETSLRRPSAVGPVLLYKLDFKHQFHRHLHFSCVYMPFIGFIQPYRAYKVRNFPPGKSAARCSSLFAGATDHEPYTTTVQRIWQ